MMTNINFNRLYIQFKNTDGKIIYFEPPSPYISIICFLQVDDGIICVLYDSYEMSDEQRRRNVVKINDSGEIVWVVMDLLDDYRKRFPGDNKILEQKKVCGFISIYTHGDKVVLNACGPDYFLDPKTGAIEFWKAERF